MKDWLIKSKDWLIKKTDWLIKNTDLILKWSIIILIVAALNLIIKLERYKTAKMTSATVERILKRLKEEKTWKTPKKTWKTPAWNKSKGWETSTW